MPSRIGLLLDMTLRDLERVLYFEDYVVIDPGADATDAVAQLLSEEDAVRSGAGRVRRGHLRQCGIGAEAVKDMLLAQLESG